MIHECAVYRLTLDLKEMCWKWTDRKRYTMQIETERAGVAIVMSDNIDFKAKIVTEEK